MVEEKQKRIDDARRALRLLRTTWIVWPNSASEVLLTGSFDPGLISSRIDLLVGIKINGFSSYYQNFVWQLPSAL
jgi:hypothetical protein